MVSMLRRTVIVLVLCGFLAVCECTIIRRNSNSDVANTVDFDQNENSTACETKRAEAAGFNSEQNVDRTARKLESVDEEVVSSRKKKDKGYGQLLLYFFGASKLTMLYVLASTVAAIAGKALVTAKVALAIATAILLKKSFEHQEKVSYEIVKHPHHTYEHTQSASFDYDHHGGYGENDLNYRKRRRIYH